MNVEDCKDSKPRGLERVTEGFRNFQTQSDSVQCCLWSELSAGILDGHRLQRRRKLSQPC